MKVKLKCIYLIMLLQPVCLLTLRTSETEGGEVVDKSGVEGFGVGGVVAVQATSLRPSACVPP